MTDRPVLLCFPFDLLSHYLRCLQLADAVRDVYDVRFQRSASYDSFVKDAGFGTFDCAAFDSDEVMEGARAFDFSWLRYETIERVFADQVRVIRDQHAAMVLGDTAPTLRMAAQTTGTKHLSLMNGYMTRHYAMTRPIATAHPAAPYADKLPPSIFDWMTRLGERTAFRQMHRPFRRLRRREGLPRTRTYLDELEGDVNLICDDPDLFPQKDMPDNYVSIGGLYHESDRPEPEISAWLDDTRPTLLASTGSSGDPSRLTFLNAPEFSACNIVVVGTEIPGLTGPNVLNRPFVNTSAILADVDLVICHGGNGSIVQALSAGIPVVCLTSIFEQEWNARRVEELGLGVWLREGTTEKEAVEAVAGWVGRKGTSALAVFGERIEVADTRRRFRHTVLDLAG